MQRRVWPSCVVQVYVLDSLVLTMTYLLKALKLGTEATLRV